MDFLKKMLYCRHLQLHYVLKASPLFICTEVLANARRGSQKLLKSLEKHQLVDFELKYDDSGRSYKEAFLELPYLWSLEDDDTEW